MPTNKDERDIEIIPPDAPGSRSRDPEWIYVSFDGSAKAFKDLPLHKRILLWAMSIAGAVVLGVIVFLIVASAVLIWIPLMLAVAVIVGVVVFFRTKFRRR